jgi:hypothetical protein
MTDKTGANSLSKHDFYQRMMYAMEHKCPKLFQHQLNEFRDIKPIHAGNEVIDEKTVRYMYYACFAREMDEPELDKCLPPSKDMDNFETIKYPRDMVERFFGCIDNSGSNTQAIINAAKLSQDHPRVVHPEWIEDEPIQPTDTDEQILKKYTKATDKCENYLYGKYATRQLFNYCWVVRACGTYDFDASDSCIERVARATKKL